MIKGSKRDYSSCLLPPLFFLLLLAIIMYALRLGLCLLLTNEVLDTN